MASASRFYLYSFIYNVPSRYALMIGRGSSSWSPRRPLASSTLVALSPPSLYKYAWRKSRKALKSFFCSFSLPIVSRSDDLTSSTVHLAPLSSSKIFRSSFWVTVKEAIDKYWFAVLSGLARTAATALPMNGKLEAKNGVWPESTILTLFVSLLKPKPVPLRPCRNTGQSQ
jgi:hypothetical protein